MKGMGFVLLAQEKKMCFLWEALLWTPKPCVGEEETSGRSTKWPRLPRDSPYDTDSKIKTEWFLLR